MLLAIDIGNTRTKAAVFEESRLISHFTFPKNGLEEQLNILLSQHCEITDIILSSVAKESIDFPIPPQINLHLVSHLWSFPFQNLYETPHTLGIDRLVLSSGATLLYPDVNRLVIDAGTCITYDFVDNQNKYQGGAISPGLRLRYSALHNYTAKLPLLDVEQPAGFIGNSTVQSIHSGVVNGALYEIEGFIEAYRRRDPNFIIILTGGNGDFFARRLKNTIFANSNFLLESLNQLFHYKNHK